MLLFLICVGLLILGYVIYGSFVDRVFGSDPNRVAPAVAMADGVDYVPMSTKKIYLIQLLNIAGLGPVFGPILGALYGPSALLWIVAGSIFAGAVHDYFSGMLSMRHNGESIPNVVGYELGAFWRQFMNYFSVILLVLVGVVFVTGPGMLLAKMTGMPLWAWVVIIFGYYFCATILPIDKLIGRLYPFFGALLLFMSIGLTIALVISPHHDLLSDGLSLTNTHPKNLPIWPLMFITIACGAISGFHATQSPMMARCIRSEKHGRMVFYGAMIGEGIVGLIWCTLGLSFYNGAPELAAAIAKGSPSGVVMDISNTLLGGGVGSILAILGVVVLPITSGDTAFRSARLTVAEYIKLPQGPVAKRLMVAVPLFVIGAILSQADFAVIWRYFGWANQTLAAIVLWAGAAYLIKAGKLHWICTVPATFMTAVTFTYIAAEKIGFSLPYTWANAIGIGAAVIALVAFFVVFHKPTLKEVGAE
ncbi:carbon starvation CstA family protein [Shumkonia mesophila]|uniref:carbon starvation CstA family protein n=1 Tax=Shumkonia mesophila TaxID=2838854 RepID=UPI00293469E8|nr:carbon starvation protein A [Shumkonia mesophila]